jgi:membrane associated rhomboid family serine protease
MTFSITLIIILLTVAASIGAFNREKIMDDLIFYPPAIKYNRQYYRFISNGFIHADYPHLIFNMVTLYSFGTILELSLYSYDCYLGSLGKLFYVLLYFFGLIASSIPDYIRHKDSNHFRSLGASGAISAVVFASIVLAPKSEVGFPFITTLKIPGYIYGILYLAVTAYLDKRGGGRINHSAHLWGSIFGIVFTVISVVLLGKVNFWENFLEGLKATPPYLLPSC